jgi:pimeloyl-ACP methyl ester carboxylesterase
MKAIFSLWALTALITLVTLTTPPAHAQLITEQQAVDMLSAHLKADEALRPHMIPSPEDDTSNTVCSQAAVGSHKMKWCIQPTDRSKNPFVVYFFHGLTLDEHRWQTADFAQEIRAIWRAKGLTPPTVISISFGRVWLLTQTRDKKYDFFVNSLMPYFEKMIGPVSAAQRIAVGESMGGFNVAQLFLKNPALFSRFAMHCPAITDVGPFDSDTDLWAFIKRTGADPLRVLLTKIIGLYEFKNEREWLAHSAVYLADQAKVLPTKVYLSCGNKDQFGFYEGTGRVAQEVANKTEGLQYVFIPGGDHGTVDTASLANFISADWN